jgi:hypothetical protein
MFLGKHDMEDKIALIMDLLAGILIGIQFLLKRQTHAKIDKAILKRLRRRITPRGQLRRSVLIIAAALTAAVILFFIIRGIIVDMRGETFNITREVISTISLLAGLMVGIGVLVLTTWLSGKVTWLRRQDPISTIFFTAFLLGMVSILVLGAVAGRISVYIISFVVAFSVGTMLMGIWIATMPFAQRYLTFKSGVLVRFGILLFIVSRIIQLFSGS